MKIPGQSEREGFYWELIQNCLVSRADRKAHYDRLRSYFLFGSSPDQSQAMYNKVNSHIDQLKSMLFAGDTLRFVIQLGASVDKKAEMPRVKPLVARINDKWQDSNADLLFGLAVTWSLVYNTMMVKLIQRGRETHPFLVDPGNFGVLREDVNMLDRQEAFVHVFLTTKAQLRRDLVSHPNKEIILARLTASRKTEAELPAGVQRIIMSTLYPLSGTMTGNAPAPLQQEDWYQPRTSEELVECYELWLWDDGAPGEDKKRGRAGGYRCVTLLDPSICVYDRLAFSPDSKDGRQLFIENEHPFVQVCPNPAYDFFWGYSEVAKLTGLQDSREHHMGQANELVDRNVNSPKAITGQWGAVEEKNLAMNKLNALISSSDPVAKIQEFKGQIPPDLWQLVDRDDLMFDEASALTNISQGRGEAGVRSKGQTDTLLRAGSARPKQRALIIEDSLERMATLYLKLDQAYDPEPLTPEVTEGQPADEFLSRQFTENYMVKVDGHSSSPVFMEQANDEAKWMFSNGIIDGEEYIDLTAPRNAQSLKVRYREIVKAKSEAAAKEQALKAAEVAGKVQRIG